MTFLLVLHAIVLSWAAPRNEAAASKEKQAEGSGRS
jgi:hypothetical protein